ncbi:putative DNA-directed RNA polymerase II subunit RPB2-like protein [Frankliniella fusca]|uniref:DNA-directed RNA polymerase II subunit RPB2-like protein n=1 Tax=Frankliniella fusca TaxID=407009 RepID=A0AAE1HKQ7_9NEOP|nr:putative DNA-directed RNA polymerase II subunit RPB2-like protein [Frankliniella fusca]
MFCTHLTGLLCLQTLLGALLSVQAADLQRLHLIPQFAGLSAAALGAVQQDAQCTTANPPGATAVKNVCDGCNAVKPCVNAGPLGWVAAASQACPTRTPWCNDGVCNATAPTGSCNTAQPDPSFTCTSSGYFPNLSSCSKYWICIGNDANPTSLQAYAGDCSAFSNAAYDPRTGQCVQKSQSTCTTVTCRGVGNQVYTPAPWMYVTCLSNSVTDALVVACANKNQSLTNGVCANACNAAGRFPWYDENSSTITDTASFYECVQNGKTFGSPVKGTCPTGSTFDVASSQCKAQAAQP